MKAKRELLEKEIKRCTHKYIGEVEEKYRNKTGPSVTEEVKIKKKTSPRAIRRREEVDKFYFNFNLLQQV